MNDYKFSVVIPVIYLTDFSRKALYDVRDNVLKFQQIFFILSCTDTVYDELLTIFNILEEKTNVKIIPSKNRASNSLRYQGMLNAETDYIYFQDCDDLVQYQDILDSFDFCTGDNVICFNINRRSIGENGEIIRETLLYSQHSYAVKRIDQLMTNIVNKLIPVVFIKSVCFYNIPFSQDISISFQLFEKCKHYYLSKPVYIYENNPKSTAGIKKTVRNSLLRVVAIQRILLRLCNNRTNAAFIKYRYGLIIQERFAFLGECYCPSFSIRAVSPFRFGLRGAANHLYHYMVAYYSCVRVCIKNLFAA